MSHKSVDGLPAFAMLETVIFGAYLCISIWEYFWNDQGDPNKIDGDVCVETEESVV